MTELPLDQILQGDCRTVLGDLPEGCVDLVFADPPYNLQLQAELYRPNLTRVDAVDDHWDQFDSFEAYDRFTRGWLEACRRVLKPNGALWVIGSYHNIHRVGTILMDLGFWILNDITWVKANPMPNFRGVRFTNAHETLIWAKRSHDRKRYTFHYKLMKALNGGKQMRSDWFIPLCTGPERLRIDGAKAHSTQKPEALLERVVHACSSHGEIVLDPFFGSGTTGAVCKRFGRHYIGVETDPDYISIARERIAGVQTLPPDPVEEDASSPPPPRLAFRELVERRLLLPGQELRFGAAGPFAVVEEDGRLRMGEARGSIHRVGSIAAGTPACNGWAHWHYDDNGTYRPINYLRERLRRDAEELAGDSGCSPAP